MLTPKLLNNGRYKIVATDYNYTTQRAGLNVVKRLDQAAIAAILWRTFPSEQSAQQFISTVTA